MILGITPKRVKSGGTHLRGKASGQHNSEETSQRWRAVGDTISDLTGPGIEPQTFRSDSMCLTTKVTGRFEIICTVHCTISKSEKKISPTFTLKFVNKTTASNNRNPT